MQARAAGDSRRACLAALARHVDRGVCEEVGEERGGTGRAPELLHLDHRAVVQPHHLLRLVH